MSIETSGQRGNAVVYALLALAMALGAVVVARSCSDEEPAPASRASTAPAAPGLPALPAPPPEPVAEAAPAVIARSDVPALSVRNPCSEALLVAVNVENSNGMRVNDGFFQVAAGARVAAVAGNGPILLHGRTVFLYTETLAMEPVELGQRNENVAGRQVGMKRVNLDPPALSTIELECPGATSGRP